MIMDKFLKKRQSSTEKEKFVPSTSTSSNTSYTPSKKIREYDNKFLEFGFSSVIKNDESRSFSLICQEVLANESLKPAKQN